MGCIECVTIPNAMPYACRTCGWTSEATKEGSAELLAELSRVTWTFQPREAIGRQKPAKAGENGESAV